MSRLNLAVWVLTCLITASCGNSSGASGDSEARAGERRPNILLVVSDDQGIDASAQYDASADPPATPNLDTLANQGLVFENAWATPACTTTRATILTGLYGVHSGVTFVPAPIADDANLLHAVLRNDEDEVAYATAAIGKWHLGGGNPDPSHPNDAGVGHYAGNVAGVIGSYTDWTLTINGAGEQSDEYHTSRIVDLAIEWLAEREEPWFMYLAFVAPHAPFHLPDDELHDRALSDDPDEIDANPRPYYLAAIEAMDHEIGRLLDALPRAERENTIVFYIGDNGTPRAVSDRTVYRGSHGKNSLYEGGLRVPLFVSGRGVTRKGEREPALVNSVDLFATIAELGGRSAGNHVDSRSFRDLLAQPGPGKRDYNYVDFEAGWAVRDDRHKLIEFNDGSRALYDLEAGIDEAEDLLAGNVDVSDIVEDLEAAAASFQRPLDAEPSDDVSDITNAILTNQSSDCADYVARTRSQVFDVLNDRAFVGDLVISVEDGKCIFETNDIPNHDFNDGAFDFANAVAEQNDTYEITTNPMFAAATTNLTLTTDDALLLNGAKVDLLAAACFEVGDERVGCNDIAQPWRFDPMFPANGFRTDTHNAHTQPDGAYHYHGPPNALFTLGSAAGSPVVGFAADGFPIFGSEFVDPTTGIVRQAESSYQLRSGARPGGAGNPAGSYDGTFRDDYEYVAGSGDLDVCNGMTIDGVYGYYITERYPYVLACFRGTPDPSFDKR